MKNANSFTQSSDVIAAIRFAEVGAANGIDMCIVDLDGTSVGVRPLNEAGGLEILEVIKGGH